MGWIKTLRLNLKLPSYAEGIEHNRKIINDMMKDDLYEPTQKRQEPQGD